MTHKETTAIAEAIRRYLEAHPEASDTVEGVRQWWLPEAHRDELHASVATALDQLAREAVVEVRTLTDGTRIYAAGSGTRRPR